MYGEEPPITLKSTAPSSPKLQETSVTAMDKLIEEKGSLTVSDTDVIQPLVLEIVTIYIPAGSESIF